MHTSHGKTQWDWNVQTVYSIAVFSRRPWYACRVVEPVWRAFISSSNNSDFILLFSTGLLLLILLLRYSHSDAGCWCRIECQWHYILLSACQLERSPESRRHRTADSMESMAFCFGICCLHNYSIGIIYLFIFHVGFVEVIDSGFCYELFCLTVFVSRSMNCPSTNSKQICNHKILSYFEKYEVNRSFE